MFAFISIIVGVVACGSGKKDNKSNANHTTTANIDNQTTGAGDATSCTDTKLEFTGEGLDLKDFKVEYAKVTATEMQTKNQKYPAVFIVLANFGKGKSYVSRPKEKGKLMLTLSFNGKTGTTIGARKYDASAEGFGKGDNFTANFSTSDKSYLFNKPTGVGEITYFDKEKVCGTVDIKNAKGTTLLKGSFSVDRK